MITTIDSFCLFVVRNHFERSGRGTPEFQDCRCRRRCRFAEQDVLEQVFEDNYARQEKTFLSLIDAYAGKRNDHGGAGDVERFYWMQKRIFANSSDPVHEMESKILAIMFGGNYVGDCQVPLSTDRPEQYRSIMTGSPVQTNRADNFEESAEEFCTLFEVIAQVIAWIS